MKSPARRDVGSPFTVECPVLHDFFPRGPDSPSVLRVCGADVLPRSGGEEVGYRAVVRCGVLERLLHQLEAAGERELAAIHGEFARNLGVVSRIGDGRNAQVVLRGCADHAGTADVDVRARHLWSDVRLRDRLLERIEVHDNIFQPFQDQDHTPEYQFQYQAGSLLLPLRGHPPSSWDLSD